MNDINVHYPNILQAALIWSLFFLICFGLGYPSINRYDPREKNTDVRRYHTLVTGSPADLPLNEYFRYRVLIPYLAKPIYFLVKGRTQSWDPVFFSLLVINSVFVAASALMIIILGLKVLGDFSVALTGALLYLLNMNMPIGHLGGMIDSGEGFFLLTIILAILFDRWLLLPLLGIFGALAKESFLPLSVSFLFIYWLAESYSKKYNLSKLLCIGSLLLTAIITVVTLRYIISGHIIYPWDMMQDQRSDISLLAGFIGCVTGPYFWYIFIWLLPLGLIRLNYFPGPFVYASLASALTALFLGSWNNGHGGIARPMFNILGPLLNLSIAFMIINKPLFSGKRKKAYK
jgi:hypothetical protein